MTRGGRLLLKKYVDFLKWEDCLVKRITFNLAMLFVGSYLVFWYCQIFTSNYDGGFFDEDSI